MARKKKLPTISDVLRNELEDGHIQEIAYDAGLNPSSLYRFVRKERGLSLESAERLLEALNLVIHAEAA